jgi:predicted unusual protein kinase regulating ubiquinone biosynthesis (AarF/ABC1/UbiB family)
MFTICYELWNYCKLSYNLYKLYNEYNRYNTINTDSCHKLIDNIHLNVIKCGAICIKFSQWLLPILDNIYIKEEDKPYWFSSLEELYENCPIHSLDYSKQLFNRELQGNFDDDYEIVDIIGSGSIGQVYKIKNKHTDKYFAFKIIHPDVKNQLIRFKRYLLLALYIPCIRDKLYKLVPVNYVQFITNFEEQINMIKEANYLLRMNYNYKDNNHIIIPQLIRCSESCLLMTYEEGKIMDKMDISDYQKTKIITLLYGFLSTNQLFDDVMHNDIHKANWKVQELSHDRYALIIYDFGFCYQKEPRDRPIIHMMTTLCESSDENTDNTEDILKMLQYFINDTTEETKQQIIKIIPDNFKADPREIFDIIIKLCNAANTIANSNGIQILITSIQCYKYFKDAGINNGNNLKNDGYRMYRERYVDLINIYTTYNCFHEYRNYMEDKLDKLDVPVNGLFDVLKDNGTVSDELKRLIKFD